MKTFRETLEETHILEVLPETEENQKVWGELVSRAHMVFNEGIIPDKAFITTDGPDNLFVFNRGPVLIQEGLYFEFGQNESYIWHCIPKVLH